MHIILPLAIIVNIISIIVMSIGLFYKFEQPKIKALFGYLIVACMIPYIVVLSILSVYRFMIKPDLYCFALFLCIISHFVIGKLVKYETLKKYTAFQIMCYIFSLIILLQKF